MARKPRITVLQPDDLCPLDRFGDWLAPKLRLSVVTLSDKDVPDLQSIGDGLLVLGGRMNANDEANHRWITPVLDLLADATEIGLPTLGICLGHQLLARALGGQVVVDDPRGEEDGPFPIQWTPAAGDDPVLGPLVALGGETIMPMSHHDTVTELPASAVELARTQRYPNAAFRVGESLGVQFHPEASPQLMQRWWSRNHHARSTKMFDTMVQVDDRVEPAARTLAEAFAAQVRG